MIASFVLIPKDLLQNRVFQFLDIVDLVYFDSALLNHRLRLHMFEQMKGAQLDTDSIKFDECSAKWFVLRNFRVSCLHVSKVVKDFADLKTLALSVNTLVSFANCETVTAETTDDFLKSCTHVKSLGFCKGFHLQMAESIATCCKDLERIDLSTNSRLNAEQLGVMLMGCASLTDIKLNYCSNWVNDECYNVIATNCPQLRYLEAHAFIQCTDYAVQVLAQHCRELRHLSLRNWSLLTDKCIAVLAACLELRAVDVSCSKHITSQGITTLVQSCTKLEEIGIPQCDEFLYFAVKDLVQHCPTLKVFRCCSTFLSDRSIRILQNCVLLHTLEFTEVNRITYYALLELLNYCAALKRLELSVNFLRSHSCSATVSGSVNANTAMHFNLVHINLASFISLTDAAFISLIRRCPNITELDLMKCSNLTDASILAVASFCSKLETFKISDVHVSDAAVCALAQGCYFLRYIFAINCSLLTDMAAFALGNNCPHLRSLRISCVKMTDVGIGYILQKCRLLRELQLVHCDDITNVLLERAAQYGARLRIFMLFKCAKIDAVAADAFRAAKQNCRLLHKCVV